MNYEDEDEREKGETVRLMLISFSFSLFGRSVMLFRLQMTFSPLSSPMYVSAHTHTHIFQVLLGTINRKLVRVMIDDLSVCTSARCFINALTYIYLTLLISRGSKRSDARSLSCSSCNDTSIRSAITTSSGQLEDLELICIDNLSSLSLSAGTLDRFSKDKLNRYGAIRANASFPLDDSSPDSRVDGHDNRTVASNE